MKKPENYEIKKWLCENIVSGLAVNRIFTGADTSKSEWVLTSTDGDEIGVPDCIARDLVVIKPNYVRVLDPSYAVMEEVARWDKYAKKEAKDLRAYERLKKKFED